MNLGECQSAVLPPRMIPCGNFQNTDLAGVHSLVGDEGLGVMLELVWVAERNPGKRSACSKIGQLES